MRIPTLTALLAVAGLALACEQQTAEEGGETMGAADTMQPAVDVAAEEQAIRALADRYEQAFSAKDIEALSTMFGADAVWIQHDGVELSGVEGIRESYTQSFVGTTTQEVEINPDDTVVAASGDVGYEIGSTTVRGTTMDGATIEETRRYVVTFRKEDGAWKLVYGMDSAPLAPEGGAPEGR
ncbi:MAG: SgcJ/EcaC family oxidoreductase [Gemmatimonadota bacterium]